MIRTLVFATLALLAAPAAAQTARPSYRPGGAVTDTNPQPVQLRCWDGANAVWVACTLSGGGGGGGGGGGDASASNQTAQIAAEQAIRDRIGALTSPAAGSTNYVLASIRDLLPGSLGAKSGAASLSVVPASDATFDTVVKSTAADRGGVFGTSAAQLMAANGARRGFSVQVQSATASCYISGQATATADYHSLQIVAGTYFETPPTHVGTGAISIICTAASTPVFAREW